ncbi:glycosyltransferase family 4 protein [Aphanothece microscopica]|uniref:glycosyltransferase family 4 protein n=1 Tax=Aphanothece microscopica TaxID=1049561 RepID=UPI003CE54B03
MRILVLTPGVFEKGGIARYNRYQINALQETFGPGSVQVMSLMGPDEDALETPFDVTYAGSARPTSLSRAIFAVYAVMKALAFSPDVVLCGHVNMAPLAKQLSRLSKAKFVLNVYARELWPKGGLRNSRRSALLSADAVISDCKNTVEYANAKGLIGVEAHIVWDCVDQSRFFPQEPDWSSLKQYGIEQSNRFKVLFLGRIKHETIYKGFVRLLELGQNLPAERFELIFVGAGDYLETLRMQAAGISGGPKVTITGPVHEAHLVDIYRTAGAFYLVSNVDEGQGEGLPLTPIEAMACGVPALVGNQDGSREILQGNGGWCGDPEDSWGQREYIERLAADSAFYASERSAALQRVIELFSYDIFREKTTNIIKDVVAR